MRGLFVSVTVAFTIALTSSANAATATWRAAELRDYFAAYAKCMVQRDRRGTAAAVLSDLDRYGLERRYGDIFVDKPVAYVFRCEQLMLREGLAINFTGEALRSALAEALINTGPKGDATADFSDRPPLTHRDPVSRQMFASYLATLSNGHKRAEVQRQYDANVALAWLSHYGECVVRHDPVGARAWIGTVPDSAEETAVVRALASAFGACVTEGQQQRMDRTSLRGTIAVNYFRLAMAKPMLRKAV